MEELIIRTLQGLATPEEEARLLRWREQAPENEGEYRVLAKLWSVTGAGRAVAEHDEVPPAPDRLIHRDDSGQEARSPSEDAGDSLLPLVDGKGSSASIRPGSRPRFGIVKAAALAAALFPAAFGLGVLWNDSDAPPALFAGSEITTGAGEMTTLTLSDGTSIRLGPESGLRLKDEGGERVAELDGRGFFGVRSDPARPFRVRTRNGDAVVLGTRFEVRSEGNRLRVLVVDGSVRVSAGDEATELTEGQIGRSKQGGRTLSSKVDDVYAHLDWMGRGLIFQETRLDRAAEEIGRRYGVDVVLEDSAPAHLTVSAAFNGQDVDHVIRVICEIIGAPCSIDGDRVRIGAPSGRI